MRHICFLLLALMLCACENSNNRTIMVQQNIVAGTPAVQSAGRVPQLTFSGDPVVTKRQFSETNDRWVEIVTMANGAVFRYEHLKTGEFPGSFTDAEALKIDMSIPFFKEKNVAFDSSKVRTFGPFTYILTSSDDYHCFAFHVNFGGSGKRGDQLAKGNWCGFVTSKSPERLESEMLDYLKDLKVNGNEISIPYAG
jgi:hypothetical protein